MEINLKTLGSQLPQMPQLAQLPAKLAPMELASILQTGAQLTASVVQAKGGNQYVLEVYHPGSQASVQVNAQSVTALESGHPLRLEVIQGGSPPLVRIVPQQAQGTDSPVENALRQFLPKQQELSNLVNQLADFGKSGGKTALPADIQQLARNLLDSLPDKNTLANADGLKQAVRDSGLFLEAKLAQLAQGGQAADPSLGNDLKAKLLVLAEALSGRPAAPQQLGAATVTLAAGAAATTPPSPAGAPPPQTAPSAAQSGGPAETLLNPTPLPGQADAAATGPAASKNGDVATAGGQDTATTAATHGGEAATMAKHAPAATHHDTTTTTPVLAGANEPALKDLSSQTEGALAKLVLNQLASLPQPDASQQVWRMDIPFTLAGQPESAKLEIQREVGDGGGQGDSGSDNAPWTVTVELNPPGLGKLGGKITLHQGTVNAFFWSDDPATAELVHGNLPLLQARLEAVGLKTGRLDASVGVAPPSDAERRPKTRLLDLRA